MTIDHGSMNKLSEEINKTDVLNKVHIHNSGTLNDKHKVTLMELLQKHKSIFSTSDTDIGRCDKIKHQTDSKVVK